MKKKILTGMVLCVILLLLSSCARLTNRPVSKKLTPIVLKEIEPILFLHGSGGTMHDFDSMLTRIQENTQETSEILRVTLRKNKTIIYHNLLTKEVHHPLIVVEYEDNNGAIEDWAKLLSRLVIDLKATYQFNQMQLVGFSNGGLAATYYAEHYATQKVAPALHRLVTIGTPFNDLEPLQKDGRFSFERPNNQTDSLTDFIQHKADLPDQLDVLSIAGTITPKDQTDSVVPLTSALAGRLIFLERSKYYREALTSGEQSSHVHLISQNEQVFDWVSAFILAPNLPTDQQLIQSVN